MSIEKERNFSMNSRISFGWSLFALLLIIIGIPLFPINRILLKLEDPVSIANWAMLEIAVIIMIFAVIQGQIKDDATAKRGVSEIIGYFLVCLFISLGLVVFNLKIIEWALIGTATKFEFNPFLIQITVYFLAYNLGYWPSRFIKQYQLGLKPME
jgi:hypothetical protein